MVLSAEEKERRKIERRNKKYNETHKEINGIVNKLCSICIEWHPMNEDYFYKNKGNNIDGFNPYCITCTKKKASKWEKDNPEAYKKLKKKYNSKADSKEKHKKRTERWRKRGKLREWQKDHPESMSEYAKRREHKKHEITKEEWENCKNYFNYRCAYCGLVIEEHYIQFNKEIRLGDFHKDHVDYEGNNDLSNCVPSCKLCNGEKHTFELTEWYNSNNPKFKQERVDKINKWLQEDYKLYIIERKKKKAVIIAKSNFKIK